jgi:hypothetical protein
MARGEQMECAYKVSSLVRVQATHTHTLVERERAKSTTLQTRTHTIDLRCETSTLDTDADINKRESLLAEQQDWLEDLEAKDLGLDELKRNAIDLDQATASLCQSDSGGVFLNHIAYEYKYITESISTHAATHNATKCKDASNRVDDDDDEMC